MKKILFFLVAASVLLSCKDNKSYTIEGTVANPEFEGKNVYVQEMTDSAMVSVDTAVVTNGAFVFKGQADSAVLRFIILDESVKEETRSRIPVLVEAGKITVKFDTLITVTGTPANESYNTFRVKDREFYQKIKDISDQYRAAMNNGTMTDSLEKEIETTYEKIAKERTDLNYDFVKSNMKNKLGEFSFSSSYNMYTPEQQKELFDMASDSYKTSKFGDYLGKRLTNLENVAIGKKFVDFTMKDPQGKDVSLSDYAGKGKYVLIDFWASWCGPCRNEIPNIVDAYNKYKNKGFEVVGVSLDKDADKWQQGLKDLKMTWPQMSDLKFWESPIVQLYAFNGIPHTVLLDKDGIIIEKDLHGEKLHSKLAELLDK